MYRITNCRQKIISLARSFHFISHSNYAIKNVGKYSIGLTTLFLTITTNYIVPQTILAESSLKKSAETETNKTIEEKTIEAKTSIQKPNEYSQSRYEIDSSPGLTRIVADTIDEIVYDDEKDVLLMVWASWCFPCKRLDGVYRQLAKSLQDVDTLVIAQLESGPNYKHDFKHGFLSENGKTFTPLFKIYPSGNKENPIQYHYTTNSDPAVDVDIVNFLHKHSTHKFDIDLILKRNKESRQQTIEQFFLDVDNDSDLHSERAAFMASPCSNLHWQCYSSWLLSTFISSKENIEKAAVIQKRHLQCMKEKKESMDQYWGKLFRHSAKNLDQIKHLFENK